MYVVLHNHPTIHHARITIDVAKLYFHLNLLTSAVVEIWIEVGNNDNKNAFEKNRTSTFD